MNVLVQACSGEHRLTPTPFTYIHSFHFEFVIILGRGEFQQYRAHSVLEVALVNQVLLQQDQQSFLACLSHLGTRDKNVSAILQLAASAFEVELQPKKFFYCCLLILLLNR